MNSNTTLQAPGQVWRVGIVLPSPCYNVWITFCSLLSLTPGHCGWNVATVQHNIHNNVIYSWRMSKHDTLMLPHTQGAACQIRPRPQVYPKIIILIWVWALWSALIPRERWADWYSSRLSCLIRSYDKKTDSPDKTSKQLPGSSKHPS